MIRHIFLLSLVLALPSCMLSLVGEAVDIQSRRSRQLAKGTVVQGQGFTVRTPQDRLYPTKDTPGKGGVTFRPTDTFLDGLVYLVTPFPVDSSATTSQAMDQWNRVVLKNGHQAEVLERKETRYRGYPATESIVDVKQHPAGGQIGAFLVVKTPSGFFVLGRGDVYYNGPENRQPVIDRCKAGLKVLKESTTF